MALFNFFKKVPNQKFKYTPRYYDERREALHERLRAIENQEKSLNKDDVRQRIKGSFAKGGATYYDRKEAGQYFNKRRTQQKRSILILLLTIVGLILLCYVVLYVYLPRLEDFMK